MQAVRILDPKILLEGASIPYVHNIGDFGDHITIKTGAVSIDLFWSSAVYKWIDHNANGKVYVDEPEAFIKWIGARII